MNYLLFTSLIVITAFSSTAFAEKADRDKPVNLEADTITVDDANKVHILEGNVQLVKGTLVIRTAKLVVTQDAAGFQKGVAYGGEGGLARFRQKREGKDEYVDGEAERIEHDDQKEVTEFFVRAVVRSGVNSGDRVSGPYIYYNGASENYRVTGGEGGATSQKRGERVRATIQPKNNGVASAPVTSAASSAKKPDAPLQVAPTLEKSQ